MSSMMTPDRLLELIAAYGADIDAYPASEQTDARKLLASDPARFADALDDARALDAAFLQLPDAAPSAAFMDALVASAPIQPQNQDIPEKVKSSYWSQLFSQSIKLPALGAFASLAIGLMIGVNTDLGTSDQSIETETETALVYAALDLQTFDYEEMQ